MLDVSEVASGTSSCRDEITDFTVADDVLDVNQTGLLQLINSNGAFDLDFSATDGHVVLRTNVATNNCAASLTDLSDNGLIEQLIGGAIENVGPVGSTFTTGNWFTVLLDNGTDTGVYKVTATGDDGNLGSGDLTIDLFGLLSSVADASTIVDANIGT